MILKTKLGKNIALDLDKWQISSATTCSIHDEVEDDYILENRSLQRARLSKSIIRDNELPINNGQIQLSDGLYEYYFLQSQREASERRMNQLFEQHKDLIFQHQELILSKGEYYLLRPQLLKSGGAYIGGFTYCLGTLLESFHDRERIYFEEIQSYQDLYLISLQGSPLSGRYVASFWCEDLRKVVEISSDKSKFFSGPLFDNLKQFKKVIGKSPIGIKLDHQDKIFEQLLDDIRKI
ncbi:MAG: hypothetical protein LAT68_12775 [Cyclobacteriaceae bacterium]|nr:hypothetical protein [Cyclobacteriaceae bacterium]MCH8517193.1 hypothetical protein [Cyclobacteriaceae bacterium]